MSKQFCFQVIQFCVSTKFSSIWPIHRPQSGATTPGQSGPGSNEGVFRIPQSVSVTETSPLDYLVSYSAHLLGGWGLTPLLICIRCILQPQPTWPSLGESYPSAEVQSVYSTAPADWALIGGALPLCWGAVGVFNSPPPANWTINLLFY